MTEFSELEAQSPKGKKLLNLCKALVVADNVDYNATKPIRKWLAENSDKFPAAKDLKSVGEQLEYNQSKPKIDELVSCCLEFLKNPANARLDKKKGSESIRKVLRRKYLWFGGLFSVVTYILPMNFVLWLVTEKWLIPIPLPGEELTQTVDYSVFYFVLYLGIALVGLFLLLVQEWNSFERILVQIQVKKKGKVTTKKNAWSTLIGILDFIRILNLSEEEREDELRYGTHESGKSGREKNGKTEFKQKHVVKEYVAKVDRNETIRIPVSVGKEFKNNEVVVCGSTTSLFRKKKLWRPFEPL